MQVTVLGSGDATGMPAPLCDCEYCRESTARRHPAVLVRTDSTTIVLDAGPDIPEQLRHVGVTSPDAFAVTHGHRDHAWGLFRLLATARFPGDFLDSVDEFSATDPDTYRTDFAVYMTASTLEKLEEISPLDRLNTYLVEEDEPFDVGDLSVSPVPLDHGRPPVDTLGFVVRADDATVGYAPDMRGFLEEPPETALDLFVCEGSGVLGQPIHGPLTDQRRAIESVSADRRVLVNVSEHIQRAHTDKLRARASEAGYELGADFATYEL